MSRQWANGSSTAWRRTRKGVLDRDGWRCRVTDVVAGRWMPHLRPYWNLLKSAPDCTGADQSKLQAHHVLGKQVTGDDPRWILTACQACNLGMGDPSRADPAPKPATKW